MERIAFGYLRLSLLEWDTLTPLELQWRVDAEIERENREYERTAQLACWVINPWLKSSGQLTVGKLLKRAWPDPQ
jgi:hypothetical protein